MRSKCLLSLLILVTAFVTTSCMWMFSELGGDSSKYPQLATEKNSVLSPSGELILEMDRSREDGMAGFRFIIRDADTNEQIFKSQEWYRLLDTCYLLWADDDDIVWVYSGDVGIFYWEKDGETWGKTDYMGDTDQIKAPDLLKELKPRHFDVLSSQGASSPSSNVSMASDSL